jgi:hypothetical protein
MIQNSALGDETKLPLVNEINVLEIKLKVLMAGRVGSGLLEQGEPIVVPYVSKTQCESDVQVVLRSVGTRGMRSSLSHRGAPRETQGDIFCFFTCSTD